MRFVKPDLDDIALPIPGDLISGFTDTRDKGKRPHESGDLAGKFGDPVIAPEDMTFIQGGQGGSALKPEDWWAHFKGSSGREFHFAHHTDISGLKPGQAFKRGEQWSTLGNVVEHPHIHMKVLDNDTPVDWPTQMGLIPASNTQVTSTGLQPVKFLKPDLDEKPASVNFVKPELETTKPMPESIDIGPLVGVPTKPLQAVAKAYDFISKLPGASTVGTILDLPYSKLAVPAAKKIAEYIPEGTIKMAPLGESGDVGNELIDFSPKKFVEEAGPLALSIPAYGMFSRALAPLAGIAKLGKGTKAVPEVKIPGAEAFPETIIGKDTTDILRTYKTAQEAATVAREAPMAGSVAPEAAGAVAAPILKAKDVLADVGEMMTSQGFPTVQVKTGKFGAMQTPMRIMERIGEDLPGFKERVFYPQRYLQKEAEIQFKGIEQVSRQIEKSLPSDSGKRIMLYAIAQQELPGRSGADFVTKVLKEKIPVLTPEEQSAYEWMRGQLGSLYNQISDARVAVGKKPFEPVDNYFTMMRLGVEPFAGDVMKLKSDFFRANAPSYPFEKARVASAKEVALDSFKVFRRYAEKTIRYSHQAPHTAAVRELATQIRSRQPFVATMLDTWMDGILGVRHPATGIKAIDDGIRALNRNLPTATLGFSIRTGLTQFSSLANSYAATGEWLFPGMMKSLSPGAWKEAHAVSRVLTQREPEIGLGKIADALLTQGRKGQASKVGFWFLRALDDYVATSTWWGARMKASRQGLKGMDAINLADDIVERTQGSAAAMSRPLAQHSDLGRFALLFETFNLNQLGQILQDIGGVGFKIPHKAERMKMGIRLLIGTAAMGAFYDSIGMPSPMPIWEGAKELYKGFTSGETTTQTLGKAGKEFAGLFPIIGNVRYGGGGLLGAGPGMLSKAAEQGVRGLESLGSEEGWLGKEPSDTLRNILVPLGQILGIPGTVPLSRLSEIPGKRTLPEAIVGRGEPEEKRSKPKRRSRKEALRGESEMLDPILQMLLLED